MYKRLTKIGLDWRSDVQSDDEQIYNRLAEIEDKIENKTLIELPCKLGDTVYEVVKGMPIQEWQIESICFNKTYPTGIIWAERTSDSAHWKFWIEDFGTKIFLTKAEAEAKLRELKENKNELV